MINFNNCFGTTYEGKHDVFGEIIWVGFLSKPYQNVPLWIIIVYFSIVGLLNIFSTYQYIKCIKKTSLLNYLLGWSWINYFFLLHVSLYSYVTRLVIYLGILHQFMEAGLADNYFLLFRGYLDPDSGHFPSITVKLPFIEALIYRNIKIFIYSMISIDLLFCILFNSLSYGMIAFYTALFTDILFISFGCLSYISQKTSYTRFISFSCLFHLLFALTVFLNCLHPPSGAFFWYLFHFFQQLSVLLSVLSHQYNVGSTSLRDELIHLTDYEPL